MSGAEKYKNWQKKFNQSIRGKFEQAEDRINDGNYPAWGAET